jgi:hypothetical protein
MRNVRIFVSSPGDVADERQRVQWIADRLSGEFSQLLQFETVLWENAVYNAHEGGFQPQIEKRARPADCDIVLAIFWSRLGTVLPDSFPERLPDGKPYPSGTAYEVLTALEARKANEHRPDVFVFRKNVIPTVPINDKAAREEADRHWERLEDFFARYFELTDKRILRVVERFRDLTEFERKVERLLRDWMKSNVSQGTIWPIEEKGSPFRGLEPFDPKHADVYCGRDRKVARAMDELLIAARRGKPFLLIPGASGSGKSSMMRAGMAPRVVRPGAVAGVDLWRVALLRLATDDNPMLALARALFVTGDVKDDPGGFGKALPELTQGAFKTPERLAQLFGGAPELAVDPILAALELVGSAEMVTRRFERPLQVNLLLLVDQMEDIFASSVTPDERRQFANLLGALVNTQRVWAIATLRGDMYERMITERPFIALKDICGQFDLGPPGPDELDEIVHRSAEAAGLQYEERTIKDNAGVEHRERLDDRLLQDAAGENTLPLLQFALNLLFEKCWVRQRSKVLTFAAYEGIGGLDGAINQSAEVALAHLIRPAGSVQFPLDKETNDEITKKINPSLEALLRKLVVPVAREQVGAEAAAERALTARLVPIQEARRDEATSQLVDALLHARILLASQSTQGSWLRLAHDRVITSWNRARAITEKNRDFYRVKDSIERQRQRWEENDRSAEYLIPAGAQITQAEEKLRQFGDEFTDATRAFVLVSSRRARRRQRLMTAATLIFALVAIVASGSSYYAKQQRERAIANYEDARNTVGGLVTSIAQKLRDRDGIRVETVEEALTQVGALVENLEARNAGDPELQRIRASMHFEFAKVFQNSRALARALQEAEKGLTLRTKLAETAGAHREWLRDEALSLDQLGDIHREMAKNLKRGDPQALEKFAAARKLFDQAYEIRVRLREEDKNNAAWAFDLSQSLVRIGDLKVIPERDLAGAKADYQQALQLMIEVLSQQPDNETWQHELAWDFNKFGETLLLSDNDLPGCLDMYAKGLCIRRYLASQKSDNTLYLRDVAFSLEKIARAKSDKKDFEGTKEPLFESLHVRQELIDKDSSQRLWLIEYAETLNQIGQSFLSTKEFELAGGFFELAIEKLELPQVAADLRARDKKTRSVAARDEVIKRLDSQGSANPSDLLSLRNNLKNRAVKKITEMQELRTKRGVIDPVRSWNELKANLKQSISELLAQRK